MKKIKRKITKIKRSAKKTKIKGTKKTSTKKISRRKNPVDYNNYEKRGTWNDAELMWTCKVCGRRPSKSQYIEKEQPEYVHHVPNCPVKLKEQGKQG